MPPHSARPLTLALATAAAVTLAFSCLDPVSSVASKSHHIPDAGSDAGPASTDASFSSCPTVCSPGDWCFWSTTVLRDAGSCPVTSASIASDSSPDGGAVYVAVCACGSFVLSGDGSPLLSKRLTDDCAQVALRLGPEGKLAALVVGSTGNLFLLERATPTSSWSQDEPTELTGPVAFALDSRGNPRIAGRAQGEVLYGERAKGVWRFEAAASAANALTGSRVQLALAPDDRPFVAYSDRAVKVASRSDAGWSQTLAAPEEGAPLSLRVDAEGSAHLLYLAQGLRYAEATPAGWISETVEAQARWGALALAGEGHGCPRAVWLIGDGLYFGERTEEGWIARSMFSSDLAEGSEPLALDPRYSPWIVQGAGALFLWHL
jgi:hypothetical protein